MKLDLSDQESQVLLNLLDEAVKAKGLLIAESALYFYNKLKQAKREEDEDDKA